MTLIGNRKCPIYVGSSCYDFILYCYEQNIESFQFAVSQTCVYLVSGDAVKAIKQQVVKLLDLEDQAEGSQASGHD